MELILKSNNKTKLARVLALAQQLGITVEQKGISTEKKEITIPKGKTVSANKLLADFGKNPDFPATDEIRSKA